MEKVIDIASGLRVPLQIPLDTKSWSISESVLSDLGVADNLAYTYFEGLVVTCQEEKSKWEWREAIDDEEGLIGVDFIYPPNWIIYGVNYSLRSFNFFKVKIEERILALEIALGNEALRDMILKYGFVQIDGTTAIIAADSFNWRLNQISFLNTPAYSTEIIAATDGYYRSDIVVGDNTGNYIYVEGVEDELASPAYQIPEGTILLAIIPIFGAIIEQVPVLPDYSTQFLKRYKSTYKTYKTIFNLMPGEDDWNVIFTGATNSEIRIFENGYSDNYIKNGAIYPFKNMGTGTVSVWFDTGVTVNSPNGLILPPREQCYIIKDDNNEWTVIIPYTNKRAPYDIFKFLQKGFGNTDLENDEIGDIFSGWSNDGTIRYTEAEWLGGVLTDSDNFRPLVQTQVQDDIVLTAYQISSLTSEKCEGILQPVNLTIYHNGVNSSPQEGDYIYTDAEGQNLFIGNLGGGDISGIFQAFTTQDNSKIIIDENGLVWPDIACR